jgi:hypothetical protein
MQLVAVLIPATLPPTLMAVVDPFERAIAAVSEEVEELVKVNLKMAMGSEAFSLSLTIPSPAIIGEKHFSVRASLMPVPAYCSVTVGQ